MPVRYAIRRFSNPIFRHRCLGDVNRFEPRTRVQVTEKWPSAKINDEKRRDLSVLTNCYCHDQNALDIAHSIPISDLCQEASDFEGF
jgi:hypothetical protein